MGHGHLPFMKKLTWQWKKSPHFQIGDWFHWFEILNCCFQGFTKKPNVPSLWTHPTELLESDGSKEANVCQTSPRDWKGERLDSHWGVSFVGYSTYSQGTNRGDPTPMVSLTGQTLINLVVIGIFFSQRWFWFGYPVGSLTNIAPESHGGWFRRSSPIGKLQASKHHCHKWAKIPCKISSSSRSGVNWWPAISRKTPIWCLGIENNDGGKVGEWNDGETTLKA